MGLVRVTGDTFTNRFGTAHDLTAADDSNDVFGSTADVITVTNETSLPADGQHFIYNKTIIFSGTAATFFLVSGGTGDNQGRHIDYINCNLIFDNCDDRFGVSNVSNITNRGRDGRAAQGAATTASLNLIGCALILYSVNTTMHAVVTDLIDSDIRYGNNETDALLLHQNRGARNSNTTEIYDSSSTNVNHNFYGPPESYDGPVIEGAGIRIGSGSTGNSSEQVIITNLQQQVGQTPNYWSFGDTNNLLFVVAGFRKVLDVANTLNVNDWTANENNQGTVIYGQPYNPTVSTTPLLDTQVIGARFRITSNANIAWNGQIDNGITTGARSQNYIQQFISNAEGRLLPVSYSLDNGGSFTDGYLDYGRAGAIASTTNTSFISTNIGGQNTQDGLTILPIQVWHTTGSNAAQGHAPTNRLQIRAYGNDINVDDTARIDANFNEGDNLLIQNDNVIGGDIVGTSVKTENIDLTTRQANAWSFDASTPVSFNDIRNYYRDGWSRYEYDAGGNPDTNVINVGLFSADATPTRNNTSIQLAASELTVTAGDLTFAETNFGTFLMRGRNLTGTTANPLTLTCTTLTTPGDISNAVVTVTNDTTVAGVEDSTINIDNVTAGAGTFSDTTWNTDSFASIRSTSFVTNNVFDRTGGISFAFIGLSGRTDLDTLFGTNYTFNNTGAITLTSATTVTIEVTQADVDLLGISLTRGNTLVSGNITYDFPAIAPSRRTYQVPAILRNGVFGVRNITTDVELVAPVVVDTGNPSTYSYQISSDTVGSDTIRYYWRPESTATNGYNTTIFDYSVALQGAITADGTQNLNPNEIPSVLWGDVIDTNIGNASMSLIEDGDEDLGGIDRAELRFINSLGILNDSATGAARTLYAGITALNGDVDYLNRMIDNELTTDYITSGGSDLQVDGRYCYLHSGDDDQQIVTAVSRVGGAPGTDANFIPKRFTFTSGGTAQSVIVLPNPEGATPGQISAGVNAGVGNAITPLENAVGYLVDDDASQIALERNENFDKTTTTYRDNVR